MRVLDLGGTSEAWRVSGLRPAEVVLLNVEQEAPAQEDWLVAVEGDACDPPASLRGERFDLVYSNSVIERVGGHWRRQRFAEVVHTMANRHWIQTPYRHFPLEPHWLIPAFQYLPVRVKAELSRRWKAGGYHERDGSLESAVSWVVAIELLSKTELRHYFPQSRIRTERVAGLPKSLVATR